MATATRRTATKPNFRIRVPSRRNGAPAISCGIFKSQGIFDRVAKRKLKRRKVAEMMAAEKPKIAWATKLFTRIVVKPTSANHHQSVTKRTRAEKEKKPRKNKPKKAPATKFLIFRRVLSLSPSGLSENLWTYSV